MHIAIISDQLIPFSQKEESVLAIRLWGLGEGLREAGITVTYLVQYDDTVACKEYNDDNPIYFFKTGELNNSIRKIKPNAVLVQNLRLAKMLQSKYLPVIIDLTGVTASITDGLSDFNSQIRKINALRKGDFFICSTEREKWFYLSWLQQSGFMVSHELISVIPTYYPRINTHNSDCNHPTFVGYDHSCVDGDSYGINSFREAVKDMDVPLYVLRNQIENPSLKLKRKDTITSTTVTSYSALEDILSTANVGVTLLDRSLESEMRIPDDAVQFLCSGLPVICNKRTAIASVIEQYDAGWTVDINDIDGIYSLVDTLVNSPELIQRAVQNTEILADRMFRNKQFLKPLISFCKKPHKYKGKTDGLLSYLIDYSEKVLNLNNPLLNDIYIEEILIFHSSTWEHLEVCLDAVDILFPMSNITILSPISSLVDDPPLASHCNLIVYEEDVFSPQMVIKTLANNVDTRFDLGVVLFENRFGEGHEMLKRSLMESGAKYKVGFSEDDKFIMLEDSIEKCISDIFDEMVELPGLNNS